MYNSNITSILIYMVRSHIIVFGDLSNDVKNHIYNICEMTTWNLLTISSEERYITPKAVSVYINGDSKLEKHII